MTTFVVEDGSGKADATAYVEIAEVTAYADQFDHPQKAAWAAANQATQELHINLGAFALDHRWLQGRCIADPFTEDQALWFPTESFDDNRNRVVDTDEIPTCLKNANCEAALLSLSGEKFLPINQEPGIKRRTWRNESEGGSEEYDVSVPASDWKEYPLIERLLEPILNYGIRVDQG